MQKALGRQKKKTLVRIKETLIHSSKNDAPQGTFSGSCGTIHLGRDIYRATSKS